MHKSRKYQNAYQATRGRIFYHAAPMMRGTYVISRDYRRKRKSCNEMAALSRRINRRSK